MRFLRIDNIRIRFWYYIIDLKLSIGFTVNNVYVVEKEIMCACMCVCVCVCVCVGVC